MISEKLAYLETVMSVLTMREVARVTGCSMANAATALGYEFDEWGGRGETLTIETYNDLLERACVRVREAQASVAAERAKGKTDIELIKDGLCPLHLSPLEDGRCPTDRGAAHPSRSSGRSPV